MDLAEAFPTGILACGCAIFDYWCSSVCFSGCQELVCGRMFMAFPVLICF